MKFVLALVILATVSWSAHAACVDDAFNCAYARSSGCGDKNGYSGSKDTTIVGIPCQVWSSDTPHQSEDKVLGDHNYCRNPDGGDPLGPWCMISDPEQEWAYCFTNCLKIERCVTIPMPNNPKQECFMMEHPGAVDEQCTSVDVNNYNGTKATTVNEIACQVWSSDTPHESEDKEVGDHNYCRNPDDDPHGPWCYTSDPELQWDYCFSNCKSLNA